jgi:hypothetical protein
VKAQILLELVLALALISSMILVFISLGNVLRNVTFLKTFQKDIVAKVFDEYRMALWVISRRNWNDIANLTLASPYSLIYNTSTNQWQIVPGSSTYTVLLNDYQIYFYLDNFEGNQNVKIVYLNVLFGNYNLQDVFLLPKTK